MNHPEKIGKYSIEKVLGAGAMGVVYKGYDAALKRHAAIKVISNKLLGNQLLRKQFFREASAVARITHPNLVTIYDLDEDFPFIAMAYVDGEDLKTLIENDQQERRPTFIPFARKLDLVTQICVGLHVAHREGVVHRDIKPGNVRIAFDGTAKLLDFGLAHLEAFDDAGKDRAKDSTATRDSGVAHPEAPNETLAGRILGTAHYMSPEQARASKNVDCRSDVFSLGVLFYELLSYRRPFDGVELNEILEKIKSQPYTHLNEVLPGIPEELSRIVNKALSKNPDDRYSSCKDFADAVREFQKILPQKQQELFSRAARPRSDLRLNTLESKKSEDLGFVDGFLLDSDEPDPLWIQRPEFDFGPLDPENDLGCLLLRQAAMRNHLQPAVRKLGEASWLVEAFDLTDQAFRSGELDECIAHLDKIIKVYPWSSKALQMREECHRLQKTPPDERFEAELECAKKFDAAGDFNESLLAATRALRYRPDDSKALDFKQRAKDILDRRQQTRLLLATARRHFWKRQFEDCLQAAERAYELEPSNAEAREIRERARVEVEVERLMAEARRCFQEERFAAVLHLLSRVLQQAPQHQEAQALRAEALPLLKVRRRRMFRVGGSVAASLCIIGSLVLWVPKFGLLTRSTTEADSGIQISAAQDGTLPATETDLALSKNAEIPMNEAKVLADEARASELAPTSYGRAQELENQARTMVQEGRHGASVQKFFEAREQYRRAAGEAKAVGRRRQQAVEQQRAEMQKVEQTYRVEQASADQLGVKELFPDRYQKAMAAAAQAQARARTFDFPGARAEFETARKILEESANEARTIQLQRDQDAIRQLMAQYQAALNNRNLAAIERAWPSPAEVVMARLRKDLANPSLEVSLDCPGPPMVAQDRATLSCKQTRKSGNEKDKSTFNSKPTFNLKKGASGWLIVGVIE